MLHDTLYLLHIIGMITIVSFAALLFFNNSLESDARKKYALIMMAASHTQLLTGFSLFFMMFADIDHMKIGIKMLFAVEVAFFTTIYKRSLEDAENPKRLFPLFIFISALTVTVIAFVL